MLRKTLIAAFVLIGNVCIAQGPVNIGTIPPGDSIVIAYYVTINNPLVPPTTTQISNQGMVSGSNFGNVLTNDPDTPAPNDPTITLLNVYPLPVILSEFKAYQKNDDIEVYWKVLSEINADRYEIERSNDGRTFQKIGEVASTNSQISIHYTFLDVQPFNGSNFYRLRMVDVDGTAKYSLIVKVSIGSNRQFINTYPNPIINNSFAIQFHNMTKGNYKLDLYNSIGELVYTKPLNHSGGSSTQVIFINKIPSGAYHLRISGETVNLSKTVIVK